MSQSLQYCDNWKPYLKYGQRNYYKPKSVIYHQGQASSNGFYYLNEGLIKISISNHVGEERIIDIVCSGRTFGEQAVDKDLYFSTATSIIGSIVYFFPYDEIKLLLEEDNQFRMLIYNNLTEKLQLLSNNILSDKLPSEKILARKILTLKELFMSNQIPFTQQELSCYTNLNRITIYNIFKKWSKNVVILTNRSIIINDIETLREISMA